MGSVAETPSVSTGGAAAGVTSATGSAVASARGRVRVDSVAGGRARFLRVGDQRVAGVRVGQSFGRTGPGPAIAVAAVAGTRRSGRGRRGRRGVSGDGASGLLQDLADDVGLLGSRGRLHAERGGNGQQLLAVFALENRAFQSLGGLHAHEHLLSGGSGISGSTRCLVTAPPGRAHGERDRSGTGGTDGTNPSLRVRHPPVVRSAGPSGHNDIDRGCRRATPNYGLRDERLDLGQVVRQGDGALGPVEQVGKVRW